ncbi:hypothetical protein [Bacillus sp. FJAT-27245]|uniref:hypothetical protein n=1 Tax=Bacillus sp. FJAT-27245 TaxID=1684144 RepID=UPI0006A7ACC7|nr:hypothetical protein [Bacillus sp. FJAT-27245]
MIGNENLIPIDFSNPILKEMNFESAIISPVNNNFCIGFFSKEMPETNNVLINLFLLEYSLEHLSYEIINELQSLSFSDISTARLFIQNLPDMSAMDFIISIKPNLLPFK